MKTKKSAILMVFILLFVSIATMIGSTVVADSMPKDEVICDGIKIGSVDVSNMTKKEAETALKKYKEKLNEKTIEIDINGTIVKTTVGELGITLKENDSIIEALKVTKYGNLIKRYKEAREIAENGLIFDLEYIFDQTLMETFLTSTECTQYNEYAQNAICKKTEDGFEIIEEKQGSILAVDETIHLIEQAMIEQNDQKKITVVAKVDVQEPEYVTADVEKCTDLLGTYTTSYKGSSKSRAGNVSNGVRLIDKAMVYPGEIFSVYETLSPFTENNGYKAAGAYLDGKIVDSIGGGICQVSTTLYNALLNAELEIVEREPHSMIVGYVEPAMDAAIAEKHKDLKFRNNTDVPIYIEAITSNEKITFNIYGKETRKANRTIEFISDIVETIQPGKDIITQDDTKPLGYRKVTQKAHIGYKAYLYKVVYENGVEVSKEKVNYSTYKAEPAYVTIGIKGRKLLFPEVTLTQDIEQYINNDEEDGQIDSCIEMDSVDFID